MCKLVVVTNRKLCRGNFLEQAALLAENGVDRIILREKDLSELEYTELAKKLHDLCRRYGRECVLHQYLSVAKRLNADGIHLPLSLAMKHREELKAAPLVGISTHSLEEVQAAQACHASYVCFGHVFPTNCKKGVPPRGVELLAGVCRQTSLPVYGLGGISPENAGEVLAAGAAGVCVMSWGMNASPQEVRQMAQLCHGMV